MSDLPVLSGQPCLDEGCSTCCQETEMLLTRADIHRLEEAGHEGFYVERDGWLALKNRDGACVFLSDDGLCTVHDDRPEGCRLYPLIFDEEAGPMRDRDVCPYTDAFEVPDGAVSRLLGLRDTLVRERSERLDGA